MKFVRKLKDESGQAMILTLLSMTVLLGFVGFAADIGTLLRAKRNLQIAADSAAIAAAAELNYGDMTAAADTAAAQNGVVIGTNGGAVAINTPPTEGAYAGQAGYVEAIVSQTQPTFFMNVFNIASQTVSARAVATNGSGSVCVYTLGATGIDINFSGGADLSLPDCGIVDDSGMTVSGGARVTAQSIGVAGSYSSSGGATVTPAPITGIAPESDPLAYLTPPTKPASCSNSGTVSGGNTLNLTFGCYNGINASGGAKLNLGPGTYYINGSLNISGGATVTGTNVTFYVTGQINLSGGAGTNLTAPTSGPYDGLLFFQARNDASQVDISGGANSTFEGIIYAPDAAANFSGGTNSTIYTSFVTNSLNLSGGTTLQSYAKLNGSTPLTSARLVE